jgi:uncharacterized membrane protein YkvA (DUF1232 family)
MVWWNALIGLAVGLFLAWVALLVLVWRATPSEKPLSEALRILPDVARLLAQLARDPSVPRRVRVRLWLLLGYLALPFDLIPDFIPVIGYADDVVLVGLVLRSVIRTAGDGAVRLHWRGTDDGLAVVERLAGLRPR